MPSSSSSSSLSTFSSNQHSTAAQSIDAVESACVRAFLALVVKLNEQQLKPLFLKLIEWVGLGGAPSDAFGAASALSSHNAVSASAAGAVVVGAASHDLCRAIMLFRCVDALLERLRAFFVPYLVYV